MAKKPRKITLPRSIKKLYPQVESAIDSDRSVQISVNRKDCKDAKKLDPTECALARAAKRELKADAVIIGISSSYIIRGKQAVRFQTPESVQREIVSFDRHQDFAPGDYVLPPKSPASRFGYHPRPGRQGGQGNGKKAKHKHISARVRVLARGSE